MNNKKISGLIEGIFSQARITGLVLAKLGFSYTALGAKQFAVSSHAEILPSIGLAIPYYGSITVGLNSELMVVNLPTRVQKVALNQDIVNKMSDLEGYGAFVNGKFKVDAVVDKPINEYFTDFSKAQISTMSSVSGSDITAKDKRDAVKSTLEHDNKPILLISTHVDNASLINEKTLDAVSKSTPTKFSVDKVRVLSLYTSSIDGFRPISKDTVIDPSSLSLSAYKVIENQNTQQKREVTLNKIKSDLNELAKAVAHSGYQASFPYMTANELSGLSDNDLEIISVKMSNVVQAHKSYADYHAAEEKGKDYTPYINAHNEAITELTKVFRSNAKKTASELIKSIDEDLAKPKYPTLEFINSDKLRSAFQEELYERVKDHYNDGKYNTTKVSIAEASFDVKKNLVNFLDSIKNFTVKMNKLDARIAFPYYDEEQIAINIGSKSEKITGDNFILKDVDTRRWSGLLCIYKGINFNLNINKGVSNVIKGFGLSVHFSLADYIGDNIKSKMAYNFFNTVKKERSTSAVDYTTAKEMASSIKASAFAEEYKKVANEDSTSTSSTFKKLTDADWKDVSNIEKDYEGVLNVHTTGHKFALTVYPYILNGDGVSFSFAIPQLNTAKLASYSFFKVSYVAVLFGNPLCDDRVSIQGTYEIFSEEINIA